MNEEQYDTTDYGQTVEHENIQKFEQVAPQRTEESRPEAWLGDAEIDELQSRWNSVQVEFVDEPRTSVEQAAGLVAETVEKVGRMLSDRKVSLDQTWANHENTSTEDLRIALQSYRSFFNRLLSM